MRKNATKIAALALSLALTVTSVNIPTNASAATVKLNTKKATLYVSGAKSKKTTTLKVTGTKKKVTFTSNKKAVATVNSKGKVTAKKAGKATITVKVAGKKKFTCKITVKKKYTPVTSVSVSPKTVSLKVGGTKTIKATVKPAKPTETGVTYKSNKTSVATVSSKGKITAKKAGSAKITVTAKGASKTGSNKKATVAVTVTKDADTPTTAPSTAPSDTPSTAPSDTPTDTPTDAPTDAPTTLGEITDIKATKANEITATFSSGIPADTKFALKQGTSEITGETTVTDATAVFKASSNLRAATYTFEATLGDVTVSKEVTVEEQKVTEIKVFDEEALTAKSNSWVSGNDDIAYVYYDVLDQYGESMKSSETVNWTTSPNYIQNDTALGRLTVKNENGFQYGSDIFVTGVHVKSGTSVSVSVKVGASQAVDTVDFAGFLNKNDKTKIVGSLPTDFPAHTYVLLYKALDQNKHPLDMNDVTIADNITFINDNPTLIDSTMDKEATVYTVDGEEYAAIKIEPGIYVDKGGEVNITAISNKTGNKSVKNFVVGSAAVLNSFQLAAPSGLVTDGDSVEIPFTATAADGTAITNYESIVRSTNALSLTASVGTLKLSEKADGTASVVWTDVVGEGNYGATGNGMSSTYDAQERSIALTTIVIGGVSNNMMLSVSDMRYPAGIKEVKYDTTVVNGATGVARAKIDNDNPATVIFTDQYGDVLKDDMAKSFFEYTAANTFNGKYYGLKAVSNDTKLLNATTVIATATGGALAIDWTADIGAGTSAETSNVKYTIVSKTSTTEWADACQAKSVTSTIVPISEVKNLSMSASGTVAIVTTYTPDLNGAKISEPSDPITASSTRGTATSWFGYSVTGKYNGVTVSIPGSYYATTSGSAINGSNEFVAANSGLKWSDLYDFNTYNNPRKTAKASIIVKVEDGSVNGTELTAKVDVSDAEPELTTVQLVSLGDVVSPVRTEINYFTAGNTVAAMNQWNGDWASNHTGDWSTVADNISGVKYTVNITNVEEATNELTHLSNSFTVSGNGTYAPVITGAEIGDKFTVTVTFENGASLTKNVTVGADTYANISSDGSNQDKVLRTDLGYNR